MTVKIEGLSETDAALAALGKSLGKAVLRRVGKAALQPMAAVAQRLAPDDPATSEAIADTVIVSTKRPKGSKSASTKAFAAARGAGLSVSEARSAARAASSGEVEVFMGPNRDPKNVQQEFGNSRHAAQPYMRPAWDTGKSIALDAIKDDLWAEVEKTAARKARREAKG